MRSRSTYSTTHLMLNLQTITEELGTLCQGRAWVVVTSQEDIDAVLGEMKTSKGNDFIKNYPFAPYQFKLLQRIFESIRKAGATGLHLAQGERSLLDAFQSAAQSISNHEVGLLVPLYAFYPSIEGFLDTTVKRTIDHARENPILVSNDWKNKPSSAETETTMLS